jgi:hypothetical protein
MIGHPAEEIEDVLAIAQLAKRVLSQGEQIIGKRAKVNVSISTFVPKPHTPFQWVKTNSIDMINEKIDLLKEELRGRGLKLNWNDPEVTQLEAWLSRGDRKLADVIWLAWKKGAKFDAWNEHFDYQIWLDAFKDVGLDPFFYTARDRCENEAFPWDHIQTGVKKSFLLEDYRLSLKGETRPDCRGECFSCGILPAYNDLRHEHPGSLWLCPEVKRN